MTNNYDEIKKLLKVSKKVLVTESDKNYFSEIKNKYNIITEDDDLSFDNITQKINPAKSVEKSIENQDKKNKEKTQTYRVSGGLITLHGLKESDIELTTDEKNAFQETMDEFVNEVSEMVNFYKLNLYPFNVEWSGKIIDFDFEFYFSIGEKNGLYINSEMIKADSDFLEKVQKLNSFYEKFKTKWGKILANRKLTSNRDEKY